jgi:ribosomal protein L31E
LWLLGKLIDVTGEEAIREAAVWMLHVRETVRFASADTAAHFIKKLVASAFSVDSLKIQRALFGTEKTNRRPPQRHRLGLVKCSIRLKLEEIREVCRVAPHDIIAI